MAIIKSFSPFQNLSNFQTFLVDDNPNSDYFRISEFTETFTGGKNGFLIEGSQFLRETTEVKVEVLDVEGNPIYFEPGDGIPEYYEGVSKLVSVHVYDDTPIGLGKITILGELKNYIGPNGEVIPIPEEWKGVYNVKWERTFKINKNLANETIVRFYKRPIVSIDELVKPIFTKSVNQVTDSESTVSGVAQLPNAGTTLVDYRGGTFYKLIKSSGSWDVDVDENTIDVNINGTTFSSRITEVLNDREVLVNIPYSENNIVSNFVSQSYSVTYQDFQNETVGESALTGSFAKIDITQLKTFVGDVARVKVYRKSRNSAADFQFVQESKLESTELLRDVTTTQNTELSYGRFDETNLSNYWVTSSNSHPTTIDSSVLSQAVKIDYDGSGVQKLITSQSFSISKDVEYTLNFRTLLSGSITDDKYLKAYFSGAYENGSTFTQSFVDVTPDGSYVVRKSISENVLAQQDVDAQLVFEFKGDDWYISNVSLKNAQDTSFSPDEFTLIQDIPRKIASETFDFRFEFYDINNNYIPVNVIASKTFNGGNDFNTTSKLLTFESDRNAFRYISGSANPTSQQIQFKTTIQNLTGSVAYFSSAFDEDGVYLTESSDWSVYPGLLTNPSNNGGLVTVTNFEGTWVGTPEDKPEVFSVIYTASIENSEEFETIYRLEDGENAPQLVVTSNANQFIYEPTTLSPKPSGQSITIRAQRKNLASIDTPITINSGSNTPGLTYVDTARGIDTYTISALEFSSSFSQNNFDEVTYSFTGSDVFGGEQSDEITLSKVINFDGVSVVLSNESTSFRSDSTGNVTSTEFDEGDGTVDVRIGSNEIPHNDGGGSKNTFDIISATPSSGLTANSTTPTTNSYGISAMSVDKGNLVLLIRYTAGDNTTTVDFTKQVSYTKSKIAAPLLSIETTNKDQSVTAKSTGEQIDDFSNSVVVVKEQYNGVTTELDLTALSATPNQASFGSISTTLTGVISLNGKTIVDGTNTIKVAVSATVTDSEGTSRTITDTIALSKVKKAPPNTLVTISPQSQTVTSSSLAVGNPTPIEISVTEGVLTYAYAGSLSDETYNISSVTNGTDNSDGTFTPDTPDSTGTQGSVTIQFQNSEGSLGSQTISFDVSVAAAGPSGSNGESGSTGPGIVFRGPYSPTTSYQFDTSNGRRDSVLYEDIYYVTLQPTTGNAPTGTETDNEYWQSLGTQDFFVAAKIAIFEDSYIQNTLNIGTNEGGTGDSANITLNGGTANPYMSIGQSGTYGSQGYDVDGVFVGMDGGIAKLSLKNGAGNYLRWTGDALELSGDLDLAGQDEINADGTFSLADGNLTYNGSVFNFSADLNLNSTNPIDGDFSDGGIYLSTEGWMSSKNFYIGSDGVAAYSGQVTAGTVAIGPDVYNGQNGLFIDANNYWVDGGTIPFALGNSAGTLRFSTSQGLGLVTNSGENSPIISMYNGSNSGAYITPFGLYLYPEGVGQLITGKIRLGSAQINGRLDGSSTDVVISTANGGVLDITGNTQITGDLDVIGAINADGNITAYASSDKRLKNNIIPISNSLQKIIKIGGYEFDWNENQKDYQGHDVGVIAQEIQEVIPEIVVERKDGYLAVRYEKLVPLLIEGIKELTNKVESLENEILKLKEK